jgi:hypothetical protein
MTEMVLQSLGCVTQVHSWLVLQGTLLNMSGMVGRAWTLELERCRLKPHFCNVITLLPSADNLTEA